MCLASEAGKMEAVVFEPEDGSSLTSLQQTTVKPQIKEEKADDDGPASCQSLALIPSLPSVTSTSTDASPPQLSSQNPCFKKKSKKKELAKSEESDETPGSAKKIIKQCNQAESNIDSVFSTIEAVAKGVWNDSEEKPKKKIQSSPGGENSGLPKKKSKPKAKIFVKEKEELDDDSGPAGQLEMREEMTDMTLKTEKEDASLGSTELEGSAAEPHSAPCSPSPAKPQEEDKGKERPGEGESSTENRGSRKSERSCKGALYKTLVSEGMLTSLRANIDRGICFNPASSLDVCDTDESFNLRQIQQTNIPQLHQFDQITVLLQQLISPEVHAAI